MSTNSNGKYISVALTLTTDTNADGLIGATTDVAQADISDLEGVTVLLNQIVDSGTATLVVDISYDGTNFVPAVASKADSDFAAGANNSIVAYTLSDANGMPLSAQLVRVRCTAYGASGKYSAAVTGRQTKNYR